MMEKDALLEIVIREIQEVEKLLETFRGNPALPPAFIKLARNKVNNVLEEIDLLEQISNEALPPVPKNEAIDLPNVPENKPVPENQTPRVEPEKPEETPSMPSPQPKTTDSAKMTGSANDENSPATGEKTEDREPEKQETAKLPDPNPRSENTESPVPSGNGKQSASPETTSKNISNGKGVLGETLGKDRSSYNDLIAQKTTDNAAHRLVTKPPVKDLKKAIGINDRFFYQRELFNGNANLLNQTLDEINQMNSMEDAQSFLHANFSWDSDNQAASDFMELIGRRFI